MAKVSAGLLLFRRVSSVIEFLLVHPGGPYFTKKQEGWWTIPKGELMENENPLAAARREFREETGNSPDGQFIPLTAVKQKGGKSVLCWAVEGNLNIEHVESNTFELEWPPRSEKTQKFPEIDKAGWFTYGEAKKVINEQQAALLDDLLTKI